MELIVTGIIKTLIFPPGFFLVLFAVALLLLKKMPIIGKSMLWAGLIIFYILSVPVTSGLLIDQLETFPALESKDLENSAAAAIVVLSSDREKDAKEYGGDTVGVNTLRRIRYGAFLQRKTGLPILVSGGWAVDKEGKSLALTMSESLKQDFQAGEVWLEDQSRTTAENAFFSNKLLQQKQIDTIFLVTQAWHMPRSVVIFEEVGLKVIAAPTAFEGSGPFEFKALLPSANALNRSRFALHEMLGSLWYRIRY